MNIVCTLLMIAGSFCYILGIIFTIIGIRNHFKCKNLRIPFDLKIKEVELPIISLYYKRTKCHFLIDTGSMYSYISEKSYRKLDGDKEFGLTGEYVESIGFTGDTELSPATIIEFNYNGFVHQHEFYVSEYLSESLQRVVNKKGKVKEVDGVLGSDFLRKYRYIIDFNKCSITRVINKASE